MIKSFLMGFWVSYRYWVTWESFFYFFILTFLKPMMSFLIWIMIFLVSKTINPNLETSKFLFMLTGMMLFSPLIDVMFGTVEILHMEREHYNIYKLILTSKANLFMYTLGRSSLLFIRGLFVFFMILWITNLLIKSQLNINLLFWLSLLIPAIGFLSIGIITSSLFVFIESVINAWIFAGIIVGPSYVICGIVFPISTLPPLLQKIAPFLPQTYWIELPRRILTGEYNLDISIQKVLLISIISSLILFVLAYFMMNFSIKKGREKGNLEIIRGI